MFIYILLTIYIDYIGVYRCALVEIGVVGEGSPPPQQTKFTKTFLVVRVRRPLLKIILKMLVTPPPEIGMDFPISRYDIICIMYYCIMFTVYCIVHILLCIHRYVNRPIFGARGKKKAPDHASPTTSARVPPSSQTDGIASRSFCTYVTHTARCTYVKVGRDSKLVLPRRTDDFYSRPSTAFLPIYYNIMPEAMHGKYIILYYAAVSHII